MSELVGTASLALAFALASYGAVAAFRRSPTLVESARTTAYALLALVCVANGVMLAALLRGDFSLRYVTQNSSRATPTFFKALALWSADEGSLLLWNLVLAAMIASVAFRFRRERPPTFPRALGVMYVTSAFYLLLVLGPTTPFASMSPAPGDGRGPLPLLQNHPLMAAHPPMLYLGFIAFTVPFAFAISALSSGRVDGEWMRASRPWTALAWVSLTAGLTLGALWSYGVLGWGGYWAWDPVENVALLPWLTATAFLHSAMVSERRNHLSTWTLSLVVATFALTVLGTFLTRGSILSSVHTFARSLVGPMYLAFFGAVLIGGSALLVARRPALAPRAGIGTHLSREALFVGNNVVLLVIAVTVLVGTIFPLLFEAVTGRKVSVGAPYFNRTVVPLAFGLLVLMGIGPPLPWRTGSLAGLLPRLRAPAWAAAATCGGLLLAGVRDPGAMLGFGLAAFAAAVTLGEMLRAARAQGGAPGAGRARALLGAASRNRRLFGGMVVHLGLLVAVIGMTSVAAFHRSAEVTLHRGEQTRFAGYDIRFDGARELRQPHRVVLAADLSVLRPGAEAPVSRLTPSLNFYPGANEPIGTPSIRLGTPLERFRELYVSVVSFAPDGSSGTFRLYLNPGILLLWCGGATMVLGGIFAALARREPRRAPASTPAADRTAVRV